MTEGPRVALVHDWLTGMRGGERCLEALCRILPESPIYTLLHIPGRVSPLIEQHDIRTSFVQSLPFSSRLYRSYLPLFPSAIERLDLREYDVVVSSSHCVAKGVIPRADAFHVCYCYTPMRYVWGSYEDYFGRDRVRGVLGYVMPVIASALRAWDVASSVRVDRFVAASMAVRDRIWRYYRRKSDVVYPPVRTEGTFLSRRDDGYYLVVSAFAPYKRIDLAVRAFDGLESRLIVVGSGQDERRLKGLAGRNVEFVGSVSDEELSKYYAGCRALVFPGVEDFGIVPLEAQCYGKPVIAFGSGGALETVIGIPDRPVAVEGRAKTASGVFFDRQDVTALRDAIKLSMRHDWDPAAIRRHALRFGGERYGAAMARIIRDATVRISRNG